MKKEPMSFSPKKKRSEVDKAEDFITKAIQQAEGQDNEQGKGNRT